MSCFSDAYDRKPASQDGRRKLSPDAAKLRDTIPLMSHGSHPAPKPTSTPALGGFSEQTALSETFARCDRYGSSAPLLYGCVWVWHRK